MRELILPDLHLDHATASRIISAIPHDHLTLLGDYFDDFGDSPLQAAATARWLVALLDAHPAASGRLTALMGNHDLPYRWPHNGALSCSGNSVEKHYAINGHMRPMHWERLECFQHTQGWLLSHAGFHPALLREYPPTASEAAQCVRAASEGHYHPWLGVGRDRGGYDQFGGIFWLDWRYFPATPGVKQIVGHTKGREVRSNDGGGSASDPQAGLGHTRYCLDTQLKHYGVLEAGELRVGAVADLPPALVPESQSAL